MSNFTSKRNGKTLVLAASYQGWNPSHWLHSPGQVPLSLRASVSLTVKWNDKMRTKWDMQLKHLSLFLAYKEVNISRDSCVTCRGPPEPSCTHCAYSSDSCWRWAIWYWSFLTQEGRICWNLNIKGVPQDLPLVWNNIVQPEFKNCFTWFMPLILKVMQYQIICPSSLSWA